MKAALLAAAFLLSAIPGAAGQNELPYVEIVSPQGGIVGEEVNLAVRAEGYELSDPYLSVTGENVGFGMPLKGCTYDKPVCRDGECPAGPIVMQCSVPLDLHSFVGQNIKITAGARENGENIYDTVEVLVSGVCAWCMK